MFGSLVSPLIGSRVCRVGWSLVFLAAQNDWLRNVMGLVPGLGQRCP
ncbi:MAG: hypothetical protein ACK583_01815 [Cyanobacteriota bacterium]